MLHDQAPRQRRPNGGLGEDFALWAQGEGAFRQRPVGERYVLGDDDIEGLSGVSDPVIGGVGRLLDQNEADVPWGSQISIGDDHDRAPRTLRRAVDRLFHRASVGVDEEGRSGQRLVIL